MAVKNTGTVVQVIGPVLDIRFADGSVRATVLQRKDMQQ